MRASDFEPLCLYAAAASHMADTLLTDLHVRYIQNLGKVSWCYFQGERYLPLLNGGAARAA